MSTTPPETLETLFANQTTTIAGNLKTNLSKVLESGSLSPEEAYLALLAAATSVNSPRLSRFATDRLESLDISGEGIAEARESAAIIGMVNTY